MKYHLIINDDNAEVLVSNATSEEMVHFAFGDKTYDVNHRPISGNCIQLSINGKSHLAYIANGDDGKHIFLKGRSYFVQDADILLQRRVKKSMHEDTPGEVTPPMPSVVVRILVEEGDLVQRGQGLIVVTAMKMETTLTSPKDGKVKRINTSVEAKVAPGDILVEIEEEGAKNE